MTVPTLTRVCVLTLDAATVCKAYKSLDLQQQAMGRSIGMKSTRVRRLLCGEVLSVFVSLGNVRKREF